MYPYTDYSDYTRTTSKPEPIPCPACGDINCFGFITIVLVFDAVGRGRQKAIHPSSNN